jgi:hypothetical protein
MNFLSSLAYWGLWLLGPGLRYLEIALGVFFAWLIAKTVHDIVYKPKEERKMSFDQERKKWILRKGNATKPRKVPRALQIVNVVITREAKSTEIATLKKNRIPIKIGTVSFSEKYYYWKKGGYFNDPSYYEIKDNGSTKNIYFDVDYSEPLDPATMILTPGSAVIEKDLQDIIIQEDTEVAESSAFILNPQTIKLMLIVGAFFLGFGLIFNSIFGILPSVVITWVP